MPAVSLVRKKAGKYLNDTYGVGSETLLRDLAHRGEGPPYRRLGGKSIVYLVSDLDRWAMAQGSTDEPEPVTLPVNPPAPITPEPHRRVDPPVDHDAIAAGLALVARIT